MHNVACFSVLALLCVCTAKPASQKFDKEYFLVKEDLSSFGANQACKNRQGRLVQIMDQTENDLVYDSLVKPAHNWVTLGGQSVVGSKDWQWFDGTPVDYADWYDEPKNDISKESSMLMEPTTGKWWYYEAGTYSAYALCEKV